MNAGSDDDRWNDVRCSYEAAYVCSGHRLKNTALSYYKDGASTTTSTTTTTTTSSMFPEFIPLPRPDGYDVLTQLAKPLPLNHEVWLDKEQKHYRNFDPADAKSWAVPTGKDKQDYAVPACVVLDGRSGKWRRNGNCMKRRKFVCSRNMNPWVQQDGLLYKKFNTLKGWEPRDVGKVRGVGEGKKLRKL